MHIITIGIIVLCVIIWLIGAICEWIGSLFKEKPAPKQQTTTYVPSYNRERHKPVKQYKAPPPTPKNDMDFF